MIKEGAPLDPVVWDAVDRAGGLEAFKSEWATGHRGVATSVGFLALDWTAVPWYKRWWRRIFPARFEVEARAYGDALEISSVNLAPFLRDTSEVDP